MRVAVGSDHAGFDLKSALAAHLSEVGHEVVDYGTWGTESVDYPDFGVAVGSGVVEGQADLGVCVCGTGIGICIAANKVKGVRGAVVHDVTSARLAKEHNNANVVCFGGRLTTPTVAIEALDAFLAAEYAGGRHQRRLDKIASLETGTGPAGA